MIRAGWVAVVQLVLAGAAFAEEDARLERPAPTSELLAYPVSGAALSVDKDGKALTGRIAGTVGKAGEVAWEVGLTGAEIDQTTQRSAVSQTFPESAGGTLDVAATWAIGFDVLRAKEQRSAIEDLCAKRPQVRSVQVDELAKALEEQAKAESTVAAVRQLVTKLKKQAVDAVKAVDDATRSGASEDALAKLQKEAEAASTDIALAEATVADADELLTEKAKQVKALFRLPPKECLSLSDLTPAEKSEVYRRAGALPPFFIVKAHARLGAQLFKYWDETSGADMKRTQYPAEIGVLAGVQLHPTMLLGAGVSRAWEWEAGTAGSICENQTVGGETTNPPTLKCHDIALSGPTPSVRWKGRLEWSQYLTKTFAITPNLQATFKSNFLELSSISGELPVFWRLPVGEEKDGKWLVLGASGAATYDFAKEEFTPGVRLFLAAAFPKF
ncbi:hypothetical protein [Archangium sp.]|uniref:hypothetical protein n=1 Tax=Archangium sp. TaxID=1872627 RepID=UPI00286BD54C|nr:hypothetical protein [Archangium sp.]